MYIYIYVYIDIYIYNSHPQESKDSPSRIGLLITKISGNTQNQGPLSHGNGAPIPVIKPGDFSGKPVL